MKDWTALAMAIIAYALGHFGGYRLCKLRVKNMLLKRIMQANSENQPAFWKDMYGKALHEIVIQL
jgi:hypothetical protein